MGCKRIQRRLKPFADGELEPRRRAGVMRHLAACRACRETLGEIEALGRLLGTLDEALPRRPLADGVLSRAGRPPRAAPGLLPWFGAPVKRWFFSPAGWVAAGLFVVGLLAGHVLFTSARQVVFPAAQGAAYPVVDLEIFSEVPPYSLERGYWEALPGLGEETA